ncbi:MAG: M48 family metallopeptidase [Tannerellaceae bacterium]|jgi:predicted Zn-dependent protease|nr:M48 family metallopeptidase [Tannerellaceae bacterium]
MKKLLLQLFSLLVLCAAIWFALSRIDFIDLFKINDKSRQLEEKLGDFYLDMITETNQEIVDEDAIRFVTEIKNRICASNKIDSTRLKVHLVMTEDVNAFALPDHHLVINSGLIYFCKNAEELAGVMSHEIAHIEKNHIMQKLAKEVGFTALSLMLTSGTGPEGGGAEGIRVLSSYAYDRQMEEQADETGVKYLQKSKINPAPLADFMYRLSVEESDIQKKLTILSTHPNTSGRAEKILSLITGEPTDYTPICTNNDWAEFREQVGASY